MSRFCWKQNWKMFVYAFLVQSQPFTLNEIPRFEKKKRIISAMLCEYGQTEFSKWSSNTLRIMECLCTSPLNYDTSVDWKPERFFSPIVKHFHQSLNTYPWRYSFHFNPQHPTHITNWHWINSLQHQFQKYLSDLENRLMKETQKRLTLEQEVHSLRDENRRLQQESLSAEQQLRRFTEWFFQTIDKQWRWGEKKEGVLELSFARPVVRWGRRCKGEVARRL